MSSLWNSLLAQADAEDRAALAVALAAELRQQLDDAGSTGAPAVSMLSPTEVAIRCGVHVETVRRAIRCGQLPAVRIGSRLRVDPDDVASWGLGAENAEPVTSEPPATRRRRRPTGVMPHAADDLRTLGMKKAS